jgi:hypothetical protein
MNAGQDPAHRGAPSGGAPKRPSASVCHHWLDDVRGHAHGPLHLPDAETTPKALHLRWSGDDVAIGGATAITRVIAVADQGHTLGSRSPRCCYRCESIRAATELRYGDPANVADRPSLSMPAPPRSAALSPGTTPTPMLIPTPRNLHVPAAPAAAAIGGATRSYCWWL